LTIYFLGTALCVTASVMEQALLVITHK
jgi:hypothetical protein